LHGDFVALADSVEPADIVTLDRVLCCYHDMPALVQASTARARRWYGLVFPRDYWWVKLGVPLLNLALRLRREPFNVFAHATEAVDDLVRTQGFQPVLHHRFWLWQVLLYERR
jgi:magnesium-protoporphyrin O-methyltransferase